MPRFSVDPFSDVECFLLLVGEFVHFWLSEETFLVTSETTEIDEADVIASETEADVAG